MNFVSENDMSFLYGFSLFETFLVNKDSKIFLLEKHIQRILNSAKFFEIKFDIIEEELNKIVLKHVDDNNLSNKILRLTIAAGNKQKGINPSIMFSSRENIYTYEKIIAGSSLCTSEVRKSESSILIQHKTSNYLENYYLLQEALNKGSDDMVFMNSKSQITETTKCNIFFVKDEVLYTPSIECGLLPGIIRQWVVKKAKDLGIICFEGNYYINELFLADEVFVTNSALGIMHVKSIDGKGINGGMSGEVTNLIRNEFANGIIY